MTIYPWQVNAASVAHIQHDNFTIQKYSGEINIPHDCQESQIILKQNDDEMQKVLVLEQSTSVSGT